MANDLDRRLLILERRTGHAGTGDDVGALWAQMKRAPDDPAAWASAARALVATFDELQRANMRLVATFDGNGFAGLLVRHGFLGDDTRQALAGDDDLLSLLVGSAPAEPTESDFQALDKALMGVLYGQTGETDGAVGPLPGALAGDAEHEDQEG